MDNNPKVVQFFSFISIASCWYCCTYYHAQQNDFVFFLPSTTMDEYIYFFFFLKKKTCWAWCRQGHYDLVFPPRWLERKDLISGSSSSSSRPSIISLTWQTTNRARNSHKLLIKEREKWKENFSAYILFHYSSARYIFQQSLAEIRSTEREPQWLSFKQNWIRHDKVFVKC